MRVCKDQDEINAMRSAVGVAQEALKATLPSIKIGATEKEIANELVIQLLRHGSQPDMPFAPIVSSGPNSANPHAVPSERKLKAGDLLVVDWGAAVDGYISDLTRTFAIGKVEDEYQQNPPESCRKPTRPGGRQRNRACQSPTWISPPGKSSKRPGTVSISRTARVTASGWSRTRTRMHAATICNCWNPG